jgi:biopolymer transport protein ExbD
MAGTFGVSELTHFVTSTNMLCLFLFLGSFIKIDVNVLNPDDVKPEQKETKEIVSLAVTGSDMLYAEVRDQHVEKFGSFLQNQAIALRESHANFTNKDKKKDLNEIHQFVKQIPVSKWCDPFLLAQTMCC